MEDETTKEENQPSASKKESQRANSTQDLYGERRKYEGRRDEQGNVSNSESFTSGSYSARSRIDMADARPEMPKPQVMKRESKPPEKKKKGRRPGRVDKRRRSVTRRQTTRRMPKRKPRKNRDLSVSTIFTRLSSQSGMRTPGCKFCGHRCCRRRFEDESRRKARKQKLKSSLKEMIVGNQGSKIIQVGSRSMMLSPLFVDMNAAPPQDFPEETNLYCEITPEMIFESLKKLCMWKQFVLTSDILDHIKSNYPANRDENELLNELVEKLKIAAVVGIVIAVAEDRWCLNCALQNRSLDKSHVTRFWQVYADTLKPITRRENDQKQHDADKLV